MLIRGLRELEGDGLVHREQYPEVPPRVEYALTREGHALTPILNRLAAWGAEHLDGAGGLADEEGAPQAQAEVRE